MILLQVVGQLLQAALPAVEFCYYRVSSVFVDAYQKMSVWSQFKGMISVASLISISSLWVFCKLFFSNACSRFKGTKNICCNYLVILFKYQLLYCMNWLCRCLNHEQMNTVKCCQWHVVSHSSTKKLEHIFWQSCSFSQGRYLQAYLCSLWISKWMVNINLWELE